MSDANSAENLLNFINTASSSVKTVLTKPGCFKRNTNHRRFLQKQLKVNIQRKDYPSKKESTKKPFSLSRTKQKSYSKRKSDALLNELTAITTPNAELCLVDTSNTKNRLKEQYQNTIFFTEQGQLQNEMQYLDECKKYSAIVDDIVDNLLESSSLNSCSSFVQNAGPTSPIYTRSGSVSSYSSSSEEDFRIDFMSGEELVQSLDISELFIPEGGASPIYEQKFQIETDLIDVQKMPIFENVFQQCSL